MHQTPCEKRWRWRDRCLNNRSSSAKSRLNKIRIIPQKKSNIHTTTMLNSFVKTFLSLICTYMNMSGISPTVVNGEIFSLWLFPDPLRLFEITVTVYDILNEQYEIESISKKIPRNGIGISTIVLVLKNIKKRKWVWR